MSSEDLAILDENLKPCFGKLGAYSSPTFSFVSLKLRDPCYGMFFYQGMVSSQDQDTESKNQLVFLLKYVISVILYP